MMMENGRGLIKALENWAKKVTTGYKDVNVHDLSTSFRDGLAFCAIIHHYRPDLINFESLSKENIFENNSLAFSVAEKQLGVPALLDAEDMVKYAHPDRLSIITYLSQLHNCFENQNKVNKKTGLKRVQSSSVGPPVKVPSVALSFSSSKRHEVCQVCKHRVFILERLIVDGKLYHTTCFRCHKCKNLLNPGAYVESETTGVYECSVCLTDEVVESSESSAEASERQSEHEICDVRTSVLKPINVPEKEFISKEAVNFAKSNLSQDSSKFKITNVLSKDSETKFEAKQDIRKGSKISTSVKDKISAFEKNQVNEKPSILVSPPLVTSGTKLQHSPVSSQSNEAGSSFLSNRFSTRQPPTSVQSPEKCDIESEKDNLSIESLPDKNSKSKEESFERINVNEKFGKGLNSEIDKDSCDTICNIDSPLSKEPSVDSKISPDETKNFNGENNVLTCKISNESPNKITRDIFKSSLSPLKLNLSSSLRKESSNSPVVSAELEKSFDIPQIKSSCPVTLPRSGIVKKLSVIKQPIEIKTSSSESSLSNEMRPQNEIIRRSSLESSNESSIKESSYKTNSKSFQRTNSSYELSSVADTNLTKTGLKSYTPIYKSLYSTSSLTDRLALKTNSYHSHTLLSSVNSGVISDRKEHDEKDLCNSENFMNSSNSTVNLNMQSEVKGLESNKDLKVSSDLAVNQEPTSKESKEEEEEYPDDLNPFGDDESVKSEEEYPDDLNPFGDDEEIVGSSHVEYDESKNPFASDEDEEAETSKDTSLRVEDKSSSFQDSISSYMSSPSGSLRGTTKKRPAPRPPNMRDIFPKDSSFNSVSPSLSKKNFQTSSPKVRKNKPAPPPPPSAQDPAANLKKTKESDNMKLKSSMTEDKQTPKQYKKKKRPAPPVPIPARRDMKKIPLREIIQEMKEIEEKQREYEMQGREIELLIRDRDKDEEPSVEEEEFIMQLFELVNQKNALFRRQAELMYIKRSQRLEEQQYQIEKEIRQLMEKPESEKTDEDRRKEEDLTMELIDIVDQRNSIIDSIEMDRKRELEEDHSVQEHLEIKNGDLPFPAEIEQKSRKNKKKKEKKEKKKQMEEESGKGTLKKKRNLLFSKRS